MLVSGRFSLLQRAAEAFFFGFFGGNGLWLFGFLFANDFAVDDSDIRIPFPSSDPS
jgi:hypothetical protein